MMRRGNRRGRAARDRQSGMWWLAAGVALCAGLMGESLSPVWAAAPGGEDGAGEVQLGSFALGDALEGTIDELDGSFGFTLPAGGLQLSWDSRGVGDDAVGLGPGWSFGLATVHTSGGVWVSTPSREMFAMDTTSPTGLSGYRRNDVRFEPAEVGATVPGRADGAVAEVPYSYVLHELGGVSTYFDHAGHPLAR